MVADALGVPPGGGALIASLDPAADRMDGAIQLGDVITRFNNEPVVDPRDLARKAAQIQVGGKAVLELYRNGKVMSVEVPIMPTGAPVESKMGAFVSAIGKTLPS